MPYIALEAELESGQGMVWARQHVLPSASPGVERQSLNRKCPESMEQQDKNWKLHLGAVQAADTGAGWRPCSVVKFVEDRS